MGVEFELKYRATEEIADKIQGDFPGGQTIRMETTYFDTPCGRLSKKRYTLRTRLENGTCVCTVKTPLPGNKRGEWEIVCDDIVSALPLLCQAGAPKELLTWAQDGVMPICGARFTRQAIDIVKAGFSAELALDSGVLTGGGKELPLCEAELEYKSGDPDAFLAFADEFAAAYGLTPEPLSKFRRALNLHLGEK